MEAGEACDGNDLGAASCQSEGYDLGTLVCNGVCSGFDVSACCAHECPVGGTVCLSDTTLGQCADSGGDECRKWGDESECQYGCAGDACLPPPVCSMSSSPAVGSYTSSFAANTNCTCSAADLSCHTLYQAKVVSIAADGWHASLRFQKADGSQIQAGRKYWIVVAASSSPTCDLLGAYVVRKSGTVAATATSFDVADVSIWPDQASYDADGAGTTKNIFVITDGGGSENQKTWFQKKALTFTKSCQ